MLWRSGTPLEDRQRTVRSLRFQIRRLGVAIVVGEWLMAAAPADAVQYDLDPIADTYLEESASPSVTHGSETTLRCKSTPGDSLRTLLEFDLTEIPMGSTVSSATLHLTTLDVDATGQPLQIFEMIGIFNEGGAKWVNAAWSYDNSVVHGSFTAPSLGPVTADLTALAQTWVDTPSENFGLMIRSVGTDDESSFASREHGNPLDRPRLVVEASAPGGNDVDLAVTNLVDDPTPGELGAATFTITALNAGPDPATGVQILSPVPAGLNHASDVASQGSYTPGSGNWLVGTIAAGDSATLDISVTIPAGLAGSFFTSHASVSALDQTDANSTNDHEHATLTVQGGQFRLMTGSYVGTGSPFSPVSALPFEPDLVVIKSGGLSAAVVRSSSMVGDVSKTPTSGAALASNKITSIDAAGFSIGSASDVNFSGVTYHWTAMQAASTALVVGAYDGDGLDDRSISGIGFSPAYVWVLGSGTTEGIHRFATLVGDSSLPFAGSGSAGPNRVQAFEADGFQVGTDARVNGSGNTYHFLAWNSGVGQAAQGTYPGDGLDDRTIGGTGFQPSLVVAQRDGGDALLRPASLAGDQTLRFSISFSGPSPNVIQQLLPDGFEVGSGELNQVGDGIHWISLAESLGPTSDLQIVTEVSDAAPNEGGTVAYQVVASNNGPDDATGVVISDLLPAGVTFQIHSATQGTYDDALGLWTVGDIQTGDADTLSVVARVDPGTATTSLRNTASVSALDQLDPVGGNDSDFTDIDVQVPEFRVAVGKYNGDGAASQTITGLGFRPDVVLIKGGSGEPPVMKTASMLGDLSKEVGSFSALYTDRIVSLDDDGFTVGGSNEVNQSGVGAYQYVAMRAATGVMALGAYVGDGLDDRPIVTGMQPDYAVVLSAEGEQATQRFADQPVNENFEFRAGAVKIDRIKDFTPTGLLLGTHNSVNDAAKDHHWIAWKNAPGQVNVDSYLGTGTDDTAINSPGFQPSYVLVRQEGTEPTVHRPDSMAVGYSQPLESGIRFLDRIQGMLPGGFEVGTSAEVNTAAETYYYTAFRDLPQADLRVAKSVDDPTPGEGDPVRFTLVVNNLGPEPATGVEVADLLPAGLTYVADTPSQGSYLSGTGIWTVGTVAAADSAVLLVDATVDPGTAGTEIVNVASIDAVNETDPAPGDESDFATVNVFGADVALSASQPSTDVSPAQSDALLFQLSIAVTKPGGVTLQQLDFDNSTTGPGTAADLDAELGTLTLYLDDGNGQIDSGIDSVLAVSAASSGVVSFGPLSRFLPDLAAASLLVGADLPLAMRDGDVLDLRLTASGSVTFDQAVTYSNSFPVNAAGDRTVDGMVASQISVAPLPFTEAPPGSTVLVYDAVIPANGYAADTLTEIRLRNQGGAVGGVDLDSVSVWSDGGDTAFDAGAGDDVLLGTVASTNMDWTFTGLSLPVPVAGQQIFATAQVAAGATPARTIRFAIDGPGATGLVMASDNDGPLDAFALSPTTLTVPFPLSALDIRGVGAGGGTLLPGGDPVSALEFEIINQAAVAESILAVTVANDGTGPGTQAELDGEWTPLSLAATTPDGTPLPGGLPSGSASLVGGLATFSGLQLELAPSDTARFTITGGAALAARDGDLLNLQLADSTAITFSRPADLNGSWPLDRPGNYEVDGMSAAQIRLGAGAAGNLLAGSTRNLVLEFVVPPNGYEADTLDFLNVRNLGTAVFGEDLERVEAWWDADDDGLFEPNGDDATAALGEMLFTGDRMERTALALPVPVTGRRIFISCDLSDLANESRTIRFALPGLPVPGLGMASANDGPIDSEVVNATTQTISTVDRLALSPEAVAPGTAVPGQTGRVLLHLTATNTYGVTKSLTGFVASNISAGSGSFAELDGEFDLLSLRADSPTGPVLATSFFSGGAAPFVGFNWDVLAGQERHLYLTGDLSMTGATDGDVLSACVTDPASLDFADATSLAASWPLNSGAAWTVNGMVAAQITNHGAPVATLGPSEGPALALDVTLPANGYASDVLQGVRLRNLGTAGGSDLAEVRLWGDGGNGTFDFGGGDDTDLGPCAFLAGDWISPALSEALPAAGLRVFASVSTSASPSDSSTVRLQIPPNGITVQSGNDGPIDAGVDNPNQIVLSTAALLASLELTPSASTIGQTVTARMTVRNVGTVAIDSIQPSALVQDVPGRLGLLSGPTPPMFSLPPDSAAVTTWSFQADSSGTVRVTGDASGVEQGSGLARRSLGSQSNAHQVFVEAVDLQLTPVESMPFSINRGQTGVVPLSLTLSSPGGAGGSDVVLLGLTLRLEDEAGAGIIPADLLSRIVVNEGTTVYLDKTALETSGSTIDLTLTTAARVESGAQATLSLALDVSPTTTVPNFRLIVDSAAALLAQDATSGAPVTISPAPGESFPVQSGLARVVGEATRLDVMAPADPAQNAAQGQPAVSLLRLQFTNPDPDSLAADVRLSSFRITVTDSAGAPLPDPELLLDRIRVRSAVQTLVDRAVGVGDGTTLGLVLSPLLSIPVETPLTLLVEGDLSATAALGGFRVELADSTFFDARDANTGLSLPAVYATDPVQGPVVTVMAPAESLLAGGAAQMPSSLLVGDVNVPALTVIMKHPGGPTTGAIRCDSLAIEPKNELGQPLLPATFIDRLEVFRRGASVGLVTDVPTTGGVIVVPLTVPAFPPGAIDSLEIRFDVEVTAPAAALQLALPPAGIYAYDENVGTRITVQPDSGAAFPLSSGLAQLESPARELVVAFEDAMPAVLSADGGMISFASLGLQNTADANAGDIRLDRLVIRAADADLVPMDVGAAILQIDAYVSGDLWATTGELDPLAKTAVLMAPAEKAVSPGIVEAVELRATLREDSDVEGLRLGLDAQGVGVLQPASSVLSILVLAQEGSSFPFWTQSGNFSESTLKDSWANFPNPFAAGREQTTFAFYLPQSGQVSMHLWSVRGRKVATLLDNVPHVAGLHQDTTWDGRNDRGEIVVNGVYLAEIAVTFADGSSERHLRKAAVVR